MSCTLNEANDHMFKVFKDAWDLTGFPAFYDDVAPAPDIGGSTPSATVWARATIRYADGFQSSLTGPLEQLKRHSRIGVVIIQVFGPVGDGSTAAYDAAQLVLNAYEKSRGIPVWFKHIRAKNVPGRSTYTQINVIADFSYDDVR